MDSVFGVIVVLVVLSGIFWLFGSCFCWLFHKEESLIFRGLIGAVIFFALFSVIELPIEKLNFPFHVLVYIEALVYAVLGIAGVVFLARGQKLSWKTPWKTPDTMTVVFLILIALQVIYGMNNGVRINGYDTAYYNGHAINALYTDTMFQYSARSGEYIGMETYVHDGYPMLIAFLAKVFFMHPLVMVNRVLACMQIILMNLTIYEIAYRLSKENVRIANWTVGIHAFISIWCYEFSEGRGFYLWQRTAESKSMLANLYLPLALLALILLAMKTESLYNWIILGLIVFVGASLSISGIFVLSAMVGIGLLTIIFSQRNWKMIFYTAVCMLPGMLSGIIRLLI